MYLGIVCGGHWVQILVLLRSVLCKVVSAAHANYSFEPYHMAVSLKVKGSSGWVFNSQARSRLQKSWRQENVRYWSVGTSLSRMGWPYCWKVLLERFSMLLWWPSWPSSVLCFCLSSQLRVVCQNSFLGVEPGNLMPETRAILGLETGATAFHDGFSYPMQRRNNSQIVYCTYGWPLETRNNRLEVQHRFCCRSGYQKWEDSAIDIV